MALGPDVNNTQQLAYRASVVPNIAQKWFQVLLQISWASCRQHPATGVQSKHCSSVVPNFAQIWFQILLQILWASCRQRPAPGVHNSSVAQNIAQIWFQILLQISWASCRQWNCHTTQIAPLLAVGNT